jgi:uncharacterized protein with PIN domain|tara:strand:- start:518 stop:667 length:150 start_codon:yes stop_codon:yes gene_type:complete
MKCKECKGYLREIKRDHMWNKKGVKKVVDILYICENCNTEWIKPVNSLI